MDSLETRDSYDDLEETDSDCPWCKDAKLRQGAEVRICPNCPFDASQPADLSDAPPYAISRYASWKSPVFSDFDSFEEGSDR